MSMENWETDITFKIHGKKKHDYGDGITFWYTRHPISELLKDPNYLSKFNGLAVRIDTHHDQHRHGDSYISAMVRNYNRNP